jgi:hypothetical protein
VAGDPEGDIIHFGQAGIICPSQEEGKWRIEWVMPPELLGSFEAVGPG